MIRMLGRLSLVLASARLAGAACGRGGEEVCLGLAVSQAVPGYEQMIRVGETFTAEYRAGDTCYGDPPPKLARVRVRWAASDSAVVRVDSVSGRVRGLAPGEAVVWALHPDTPPNPDDALAGIRVHVR